MKQCNKCGKENNDDSLFCSKCGEELNLVENIPSISEREYQDKFKSIYQEKSSKKKTSYLKYWLYSIPIIFLFTLFLKSIMPEASSTTKLPEHKEKVMSFVQVNDHDILINVSCDTLNLLNLKTESVSIYFRVGKEEVDGSVTHGLYRNKNSTLELAWTDKKGMLRRNNVVYEFWRFQ